MGAKSSAKSEKLCGSRLPKCPHRRWRGRLGGGRCLTWARVGCSRQTTDSVPHASRFTLHASHPSIAGVLSGLLPSTRAGHKIAPWACSLPFRNAHFPHASFNLHASQHGGAPGKGRAMTAHDSPPAVSQAAWTGVSLQYATNTQADVISGYSAGYELCYSKWNRHYEFICTQAMRAVDEDGRREGEG